MILVTQNVQSPRTRIENHWNKARRFDTEHKEREPNSFWIWDAKKEIARSIPHVCDPEQDAKSESHFSVLPLPLRLTPSPRPSKPSGKR